MATNIEPDNTASQVGSGFTSQASLQSLSWSVTVHIPNQHMVKVTSKLSGVPGSQQSTES